MHSLSILCSLLHTKRVGKQLMWSIDRREQSGKSYYPGWERKVTMGKYEDLGENWQRAHLMFLKIPQYLSWNSDFGNLTLGYSENISLNQIPGWHARVRLEMFGNHSLQSNFFLFHSLSFFSPPENKGCLRITTYVWRR